MNLLTMQDIKKIFDDHDYAVPNDVDLYFYLRRCGLLPEALNENEDPLYSELKFYDMIIEIDAFNLMNGTDPFCDSLIDLALEKRSLLR